MSTLCQERVSTSDKVLNCVESVHCVEIVQFYMFYVSHIQIFHSGDHRYYKIENMWHPEVTLTSFR